jgi:hypothetical protein
MQEVTHRDSRDSLIYVSNMILWWATALEEENLL